MATLAILDCSFASQPFRKSPQLHLFKSSRQLETRLSTPTHLCQTIQPHQRTKTGTKINLKNRNIFGAVGIRDFWCQWAGTKHSGELTKSMKAWISLTFQNSCDIGPVVTSTRSSTTAAKCCTTSPSWNEICKLPWMFWTESSRSLVLICSYFWDLFFDQIWNRMRLRWWGWNWLTKLCRNDYVGNVGLRASGRRGWQVVEVVGEAVEVTASPMSQLFWKVNEIKTFTTSWKLARVLWTESSRSLAPKVMDSNCAENVPVFTIYFLTKVDRVDKAELGWRLWQHWSASFHSHSIPNIFHSLNAISRIQVTTPTWNRKSNVANLSTRSSLVRQFRQTNVQKQEQK